MPLVAEDVRIITKNFILSGMIGVAMIFLILVYWSCYDCFFYNQFSSVVNNQNHKDLISMARNKAEAKKAEAKKANQNEVSDTSPGPHSPEEKSPSPSVPKKVVTFYRFVFDLLRNETLLRGIARLHQAPSPQVFKKRLKKVFDCIFNASKVFDVISDNVAGSDAVFPVVKKEEPALKIKSCIILKITPLDRLASEHQSEQQVLRVTIKPRVHFKQDEKNETTKLDKSNALIITDNNELDIKRVLLSLSQLGLDSDRELKFDDNQRLFLQKVFRVLCCFAEMCVAHREKNAVIKAINDFDLSVIKSILKTVKVEEIASEQEIKEVKMLLDQQQQSEVKIKIKKWAESLWGKRINTVKEQYGCSDIEDDFNFSACGNAVFLSFLLRKYMFNGNETQSKDSRNDLKRALRMSSYVLKDSVAIECMLHRLLCSNFLEHVKSIETKKFYGVFGQSYASSKDVIRSYSGSVNKNTYPKLTHLFLLFFHQLKKKKTSRILNTATALLNLVRERKDLHLGAYIYSCVYRNTSLSSLPALTTSGALGNILGLRVLRRYKKVVQIYPDAWIQCRLTAASNNPYVNAYRVIWEQIYPPRRQSLGNTIDSHVLTPKIFRYIMLNPSAPIGIKFRAAVAFGLASQNILITRGMDQALFAQADLALRAEEERFKETLKGTTDFINPSELIDSNISPDKLVTQVLRFILSLDNMSSIRPFRARMRLDDVLRRETFPDCISSHSRDRGAVESFEEPVNIDQWVNRFKDQSISEFTKAVRGLDIRYSQDFEILLFQLARLFEKSVFVSSTRHLYFLLISVLIQKADWFTCKKKLLPKSIRSSIKKKILSAHKKSSPEEMVRYYILGLFDAVIKFSYYLKAVGNSQTPLSLTEVKKHRVYLDFVFNLFSSINAAYLSKDNAMRCKFTVDLLFGYLYGYSLFDEAFFDVFLSSLKLCELNESDKSVEVNILLLARYLFDTQKQEVEKKQDQKQKESEKRQVQETQDQEQKPKQEKETAQKIENKKNEEQNKFIVLKMAVVNSLRKEFNEKAAFCYALLIKKFHKEMGLRPVSYIRYLKKLAVRGHVESCRMLGEWYKEKKRSCRSRHYFKKAANLGDVASMLELAKSRLLKYATLRKIENFSKTKAFALLERSANAGSLEACCLLGDYYVFLKDYYVASVHYYNALGLSSLEGLLKFSYYYSRINNNQTYDQLLLYSRYEVYEETRRNPSPQGEHLNILSGFFYDTMNSWSHSYYDQLFLSVVCYRKALKEKSVQARFWLLRLRQEAHNKKGKYTADVRQKGASVANFKLGLFYSQEDGLRKSRRCFKRVVQSDGNECYAEACYQLALSYQQGGWLLRNLNKANYYLMQSFNKGFALAQILYYEHQIEDYCGQVGTHILNHNIDQAIAGLENHLQPQNYLGSVDSKRALELWIRLTACKGLYQAEYKNTRSRIVKYLEEFKQQHKDACNVFSEFDFLLGLASDQRITDKFFLELIKYKFKNFLNPEAIQQNFATCTDDAVILCYEAAHKQLGVDHQLRPYLNALSYNAIIPKTDESDDCKPVAEVPLVISA